MLERFHQQWLILHNETFPRPISQWKQRDNTGKIVLNIVLGKRYRMTSFVAVNAHKTIERPLMKQAFQNALIILKRHFHVWSQCQGKHLRPHIFWSHWSLIRRDQWKRKRLERSCFHWETSLETFEQSALKRSRASSLFLHRAFQVFRAFQFLKCNSTWHSRPCY